MCRLHYVSFKSECLVAQCSSEGGRLFYVRKKLTVLKKKQVYYVQKVDANLYIYFVKFTF